VIRALGRYAGFVALGVAVAGWSGLRLADVNPTLRGPSGLVFLAWWCGAFAALGVAVGVLHALAARFLAEADMRDHAMSFARGLALSAAIAGAFAVTVFVASGPMRWGLRGAVALGAAALAARLRVGTPVWLERAALAVALAFAVALPFRAALQIRANAPLQIATPPPALAGAQPPLIVIGLDGLEWGKLDPLMAAGRLPAFSALVAHAATAPLRTLVPTWSPIVWSTIATGTNEERHGVRDFSEMRFPGMSCGVQRLRKSPTLLPAGLGVPTLVRLLHGSGLLAEVPVTGCHRTEPAFWDVHSEAGGTAAVVGWYATWPAYPLRGSMVSDNNPARAAFQATEFDGHLADDGITEPPELLARLSKLPVPADLGSDELTLATPVFSELSAAERESLRGTPSLALYRTIRATDSFAFRSAKELLTKDHPSLIAIYATGIDNVSHRHGKRPGVVDHYYEWIDTQLGDLLAAVPAEAMVMVVSDHGWHYEASTFGHGDAPDGVFLLAGPGVPAGRLASAPHVRDIAPTALALLGLPPGTRIEGEAVWSALPPGVRESAQRRKPQDYATLTRRKPRAGSAPRLQEETMERLKALGYVE
jgi:hypothetical protein